MAVTTTWTQAHLAALEEAYASGVTEVTYDGKTVKYRSLAELAQAISAIRLALSPEVPRQHYPRFSKGL